MQGFLASPVWPASQTGQESRFGHPVRSTGQVWSGHPARSVPVTRPSSVSPAVEVDRPYRPITRSGRSEYPSHPVSPASCSGRSTSELKICGGGGDGVRVPGQQRKCEATGSRSTDGMHRTKGAFGRKPASMRANATRKLTIHRRHYCDWGDWIPVVLCFKGFSAARCVDVDEKCITCRATKPLTSKCRRGPMLALLATRSFWPIFRSGHPMSP